MLKKLLFFAFFAANSHLFAAPAPDFTITDSDGNVRHLYSDYINQGKVVVLEIFFINCPPCNTHAPYWKALYDSIKVQYPGQVEFILLSDKSADNNAAVAQYKVSKSLSMPAAGSNGGSLDAVQPYKSGLFGPFYGTPTFVIIAPGTGEVTFDIRGNDPAETMGMLGQEIAGFFLPKCHIKTYQGDTLLNYRMQVAVPGGVSQTVQVTNGEYSLENFAGLPNVPFYTATPTKTDNPLNGVSTFDLVQINKQILGIELFTQPWQLIAADANGSGSLTTFDIVELRKLILGIYDSLPTVPSWVFSPAFDTISPLECSDFFAIKKGDVNGNANPAGLITGPDDRSGPELPLLPDNRFLKAGTVQRLTFRAGRAGYWQGFQAAFRFDPGCLTPVTVTSASLTSLEKDNWHLSEGRLALSWFSSHPRAVEEDAPLLTVDVRVLRDVWSADALILETAPLRAEAYDAAGDPHPVSRQVTPAPARGQIWPNPSQGPFLVHTVSSGIQQTYLHLIDVQGKVVFSIPVDLVDGDNVLDVQPGYLPAGIYQLRLGGQWVGRLIRQ